MLNHRLTHNAHITCLSGLLYPDSESIDSDDDRKIGRCFLRSLLAIKMPKADADSVELAGASVNANDYIINLNTPDQNCLDITLWGRKKDLAKLQTCIYVIINYYIYASL
jgi:hypothetical protein